MILFQIDPDCVFPVPFKSHAPWAVDLEIYRGEGNEVPLGHGLSQVQEHG